MQTFKGGQDHRAGPNGNLNTAFVGMLGTAILCRPELTAAELDFTDRSDQKGTWTDGFLKAADPLKNIF